MFPVVISAAFSLVAIAGLILLAVHNVDKTAIDGSRMTVKAVLSEVGRVNAYQARDYGWWDEAVRNLVLNLDKDWADANVGELVTGLENITKVVIVKDHDDVVYTFPERDNLPAFGTFQDAGLRDLLKKLTLGAAAEESSGSTLLTIDGRLYSLGASRIFPQDLPNSPTLRESDVATIILFQELDAAWMQEVGLGHGIEHVELKQTPASAHNAALELLTSGGKPLGTLRWHVRLPGADMIPTLLLPVTLLLIIVTALTAFFGVRANALVTRLADREATVSDANVLLKRARDEADKANASKSDFLAMMGHEIRTPLNGILGMADILGRETEGTPMAQRAAIIRQSGEALLRLLDDLLNLSKADQDAIEIESLVFSPHDLVEDLVTLWSPLMAEKGLKFNISNLEDPNLMLNGDAGRIQQILHNLVNNALKFTDAGGISLSADTKDLGKQVGLRFKIEDTGSGIAEESLEHVFEKFTQEDSSISRTHGGSGLGLAISRKLAQLMGGNVVASRSADGGTIMTVNLTIERAPQGTARRQNSAEIIGKIPSLNILVVEDVALGRVVIETLLTQDDHTCVLTESGEEALQTITEQPFDLVLMDVQMPGMNGMEATRKIRGLDNPAANIPIIALTANVMAGDREQYLAAGMNDYVAKPVRREALHAAIRRTLKLRPDGAFRSGKEHGQSSDKGQQPDASTMPDRTLESL